MGTELSEVMRMLVKRMETNQEEFIKDEWDPVLHNAWDIEPFENTRWGNIIRASMTSGKELLFDDEELKVLLDNYRTLLKTRMEECIIRELVGSERKKQLAFDEKQMDLPYMSPSTITSPTRTINTQKDEWVKAYRNLKDEGML